jgi:hypothetical protein
LLNRFPPTPRTALAERATGLVRTRFPLRPPWGSVISIAARRDLGLLFRHRLQRVGRESERRQDRRRDLHSRNRRRQLRSSQGRLRDQHVGVVARESALLRVLGRAVGMGPRRNWTSKVMSRAGGSPLGSGPGGLKKQATPLPSSAAPMLPKATFGGRPRLRRQCTNSPAAHTAIEASPFFQAPPARSVH